jgi:YVTN family beta-propeller protein
MDDSEAGSTRQPKRGRARQRGPERFLATVLFTDIVGSTVLAAELGDRGWRDLIQEHHRIVRATLRRFGGREVDTAGDGFFAVFDAPAAAIECALEARDAVTSLGLEIRAGLHAGEVEQIAGKLGGITVPIAARIMSSAGPGEVLVSSTVRDLAAGADFQFEDRGAHELKGVPGEWRVYAVIREPMPAAASAGEAGAAANARSEGDRAARRAAAVARFQARPIWQRHPRAVSAIVAVLVAAVGGTGLWIWSPWLPPALPGVSENSVGLIDVGRNVVVADAPIGSEPAAIAFGAGSLWTANSGDDTVSQIDPAAHAVIDTIDVGKAPDGIAVGANSVWVADGGAGAVTRINATTRRVVQTITVGNGPRAIAFGGGAVWVADGGDGTVTRIDAASGTAGAPISLPALPTAIAADDSATWVASEDAGTVTELDPATGRVLAAPIAVGSRPEALAIGDGELWVANAADGSISRVDPASHRVSGVIDVGGSPVGLALAGSTLWVADSTGAVERVDVADAAAVPIRIAAGSSPQGVVSADGELWFVTRASAASHRGGTLNLVSIFPRRIDPDEEHLQDIGILLGDGLVGYRRVGGVAGTQLLPDLATSIPTPTDAGLTYTFQLRGGLVYSDGSPVKASDFVFAFERVFQVADPDLGDFASGFYTGLRGVDACANSPVQHCDVSQAVVADDAAATVTFHLATPNPDFPYLLALPYAFPLPRGSVPANDPITGPYPVTGPYEIASVSDNVVNLVRNPRFQAWDPAVRPDGYVDGFQVTFGADPADAVAMVESGQADYMIGQIPADSFPTLRTQYAPQLHIASVNTTYLFLNTKIAPFDDQRVRQAVNLAIDRNQIVDLRGGPIAAQTTCQVLPPNFPGYEPYCPYTANPGPDGRWSAPDMDAARALVAASGTAGAKIVVGPVTPRLNPLAEYVTSVLSDLGYDASTETVTKASDAFQAIFGDQRVAVGAFAYTADYPSPADFLEQLNCEGGVATTNYCSVELTAAMQQAAQLQLTDPAAANGQWAAIDRQLTDLAVWAPLVNEGSQLVSARLGGYQFNVAIGVLLDQAWVQ